MKDVLQNKGGVTMNKTELVQVKVTKKQKEQLIKNAEKKDLKLTDYIREKLFNK
jgi:hypothetical protein